MTRRPADVLAALARVLAAVRERGPAVVNAVCPREV
jgi:hypothetical protein